MTVGALGSVAVAFVVAALGFVAGRRWAVRASGDDTVTLALTSKVGARTVTTNYDGPASGIHAAMALHCRAVSEVTP